MIANKLSLAQITNSVAVFGKKRTVLVRGPMGSGKSSILKTLKGHMFPQFANHAAVYFDCTTKLPGDISLPRLSSIDSLGYVTMVPHEELGLHLRKPLLLMVDEIGKADEGVLKAMLRLMLERVGPGGIALHPDSVVFATTNMAAEGLGDMIPAHARNRIIILNTRTSTAQEWIEMFARNAGIHAAVMGWVVETPQVFADFDEVKDPKDNPHIFHPKIQRESFCTARSIHAASDILHDAEDNPDLIDHQQLISALIGTIGPDSAAELLMHYKMSQQMPSIASIKADPMTAKVPTSQAVRCMIINKVLGMVNREFIDPWMTYLGRLPEEEQAMFGKGATAKSYDPVRQQIVVTSPGYTAWAMKNAYMLRKDQ
jgi:energy-coupling factor transporter ATP-binding protein EcfA2